MHHPAVLLESAPGVEQVLHWWEPGLCHRKCLINRLRTEVELVAPSSHTCHRNPPSIATELAPTPLLAGAEFGKLSVAHQIATL